jgi:cytochrome c oxidase assembly factor CtaG
LIFAHTGHHEAIASVWEAPVAVLAGAALALALFGQAFVRLRRRGRKDHAGWDRAALFALAVALGTLALVSPLDYIGEEYLLSAHMLQHVIIGDVAVALAVVALRGPLTFFLIPSNVLGRLARLTSLRSGLRLLLNPKVAFVLWAVVIAAWHVSPLRSRSLRRGKSSPTFLSSRCGRSTRATRTSPSGSWGCPRFRTRGSPAS